MAMANAAETLHGTKDNKLKKAVALVEDLVSNGFHPIVFCRFIPTAEYVAAELRKKLKGVAVVAVTGLLPPNEREERVTNSAIRTSEYSSVPTVSARESIYSICLTLSSTTTCPGTRPGMNNGKDGWIVTASQAQTFVC